MAKIIKLGSICFDGNQTVPGSELFEQQFSIEDTCPGMELQWVDDGNLLVADRVICTGISWDQLNQLGFVFGTKIIIDGKPYLCRCLKVGNNENIPREWDTLLDKYGEDNNLWHWENKYFWGQESAQSLVSGHVMRAVRGYRSARDWSCCNPTGRYTNAGFRPALEPLVSEFSKALLGSNIKVFGPGGETFEGQLNEYDDYDFMFVSKSEINFNWTIRQAGKIVVSKDDIIGIKKIQL